MKYLAIILALTTAIPAFAGGPVIIEDTTETVAPRKDRKIGGLVVGLIVIAAIAALAGGSDACNGPEDPVTPQPGGGC